MLELELGPSPSSSCGVASVPHSFSSVIKTVVVVQFLSQQPGRDCVVVTRAEQVEAVILRLGEWRGALAAPSLATS